MKRFTLTLVFVAACLLVSAGHAEQIDLVLTGNGGAGLLPSNVTPPTSSTGYGGERDLGITLDTDLNTLFINIAWGSDNGFGDLTGEVTLLHLHGPTPDRAPISFGQTNSQSFINLATNNFDSSPTGGGLDDNFFVTNTEIQDILDGRYYINVHTEMYPMGEIRGYLVRADFVPEPGSLCLLGFMILGIAGRRRR